MKMNTIFLSASIPVPGRQYYDGSNPIIIREAIVAFTRVCMEYGIRFYFGGHPAISPLVYQIAKNCLGDADAPIQIYQSEYFKDKIPEEVSFYRNIVWTPRGESKEDSVSIMRKRMFDDNRNNTCCAVFIGGMDGIIKEAYDLREWEGLDMMPVASTGCAAEEVYRRLNINNSILYSDYAYVSVFRSLLLKYKDNETGPL